MPLSSKPTVFTFTYVQEKMKWNELGNGDKETHEYLALTSNIKGITKYIFGAMY